MVEQCLDSDLIYLLAHAFQFLLKYTPIAEVKPMVISATQVHTSFSYRLEEDR